MGRKAIQKVRFDNPNKKIEWVKKLSRTFHEKGISPFTMDDIAILLEKSKATVYKYFTTKEEIVELCVAYNLSEIAKFENILKDESMEYVVRYTESTKVFMENISLMSVDYLNDLKKNYPALWKKITDFQEYSLHVLSDYYAVGIKKGIFNDIHPAILALSDQLFFNAILNPKFLKSNSLTLKKAFEEYFKMKCFGMLKPIGAH
jgi:AcrR family transcriptional regulator